MLRWRSSAGNGVRLEEKPNLKTTGVIFTRVAENTILWAVGVNVADTCTHRPHLLCWRTVTS